MEKSKVYFTNFRVNYNMNLLQKLDKLIKSAGIEQIDFKDKFTAIKIHFGELGNLSFLRPNYSKVVADLIKSKGGKPFLTDCNTLYVGSRKNALDHIETAYLNGFSPFSTGCNIIIGDGLKGNDYLPIPINCKYVKEAKIGSAIAEADIIISLNHFKGHEATGFGGALKNIGMGCGSRAGKMEMHSSGKPHVNKEDCISCGTCTKQCAHSAISFIDKKANIDHNKCVGCGRCIEACPVHTIYPASDESNDILNKKIAEYSYAVLKDKPNFHISLVVDVSPFCDCHGENDVPIIPDVGMFASFDPVALDMACVDMANKQAPIKESIISDREYIKDHFKCVHPTTNWEVGIDYAVEIGLGNKDYELIQI